jgi:tripartite-type tricarboxylate transporter receptor subunit TctC
MRRGITACAAVLSFVALMIGAATAQEFYRGKTIKIIVSSASGGGYDQYARMIARHMPKHIPGNPTMVLVNMLGAGGMTADSHRAAA